jgi:hypothetical protein
VREQRVYQGLLVVGEVAFTFRTRSEAHACMEQSGGVWVERMRGDDPCIVGLWIV